MPSTRPVHLPTRCQHCNTVEVNILFVGDVFGSAGRRIVAEHNGTIRIDDNKPVGARFTIRIPVAEPVTASAPASNLTSSGNGQAQAQTQTPTAAAASPSEAAAQPHKST